MDETRAARIELTRLERGVASRAEDLVAREEPLEIRVEGRSVAVVMRTPGHDDELVAGFLLTEGVVKCAADIFEISPCPATSAGGNVIDVLLTSGLTVSWESLTRHVFASSSCGVCGKATLDSVFMRFPPVTSPLKVSSAILQSLPEKLRAAQETFVQTGGLHASAIFDLEGKLVVLREDVGRHNALDKALGHALRSGRLPLKTTFLCSAGAYPLS